MDIQNISLKELKPYPLNAKKHPPEQIEKLVRSINLTGFTQPIVVNKEGNELVIIAGHGRYLASLQMNLKTVPCMVLEVPKLVADQARLMDNKSAESDYDIELLIKELSKFNTDEIIDTGYDETELNKLILELEETLDEFNDENVEIKSFDEEKEDEIPEESEVETRVKLGDIWQLGNHYLLCGDCTVESNINALFGDKKVDMVFTSPPYNANQKIGTSSYGKTERKTETIKPFYQEYQDNLTSDEYINFCLNVLKNIDKISKQNTSILWNVWRISNRDGDNMQNGHGASFPVALPTEGINRFSPNNALVFDPFLGSGTTLIACEKTNRICYGTEISENYCDVILKRWEKLTGKTAVFIKNIES